MSIHPEQGGSDWRVHAGSLCKYAIDVRAWVWKMGGWIAPGAGCGSAAGHAWD